MSLRSECLKTSIVCLTSSQLLSLWWVKFSNILLLSPMHNWATNWSRTVVQPTSDIYTDPRSTHRIHLSDIWHRPNALHGVSQNRTTRTVLGDNTTGLQVRYSAVARFCAGLSTHKYHHLSASTGLFFTFGFSDLRWLPSFEFLSKWTNCRLELLMMLA